MNLLGFFKFFSDILELVKQFRSTPQERHDDVRREISEAFKKAKENKDPTGIAELLGKRK